MLYLDENETIIYIPIKFYRWSFTNVKYAHERKAWIDNGLG